MKELKVVDRFVDTLFEAWKTCDVPNPSGHDRVRRGIEALSADLGFRSAMADLLVEEGYVSWTAPDHYKYAPIGTAYLCLGQLADRLEEEVAENPTKRIAIGFDSAHSYRGYYEQLAFEMRPDMLVADMAIEVRAAIGKTFEGYKGGDYLMDETTDVWLAEYGCTSDNRLGPVLLELLLRQEVKS